MPILALLPACAGGGDAPRQDAAPVPPQLVTLNATEYAFQAPDTITAGWVTFRMSNHGQEIHYGHVVRLEGDRNARDLVEAYAEAIRTSGPRPKWVLRFGGPGGTTPGDSSSVTQYLEPGSYVWICPVEDSEGNPHFGKGEFKPFVVAGPAGRAGRPAADIVIRLADFSFQLDSLPTGRHTVRVENTGVEPHDLAIMKLAPGMTIEDLATMLNPERARRPDQANGPPPSPEPPGTLAGGVAAIAPGMESFFDTEFTPGDYVLFCMATAPDGRSHIEHGMIQQIRVH
jgi:hypothetical protein